LKGFHALQAYRIGHWLWNQGRRALAIFLQNQVSVSFQVDIHPAAKIGRGIMLDHATGIVVGETAVIEDDVDSAISDAGRYWQNQRRSSPENS
jgi:serine O-acetyltransferase